MSSTSNTPKCCGYKLGKCVFVIVSAEIAVSAALFISVNVPFYLENEEPEELVPKIFNGSANVTQINDVVDPDYIAMFQNMLDNIKSWFLLFYIITLVLMIGFSSFALIVGLCRSARWPLVPHLIVTGVFGVAVFSKVFVFEMEKLKLSSILMAVVIESFLVLASVLEYRHYRYLKRQCSINYYVELD